MSLSELNLQYYFGHVVPVRLFDFDANGDLIYKGYARPGTPVTSANWIIEKFTNTNGNPTGDSYLVNVRWDERASLTFP